MERACEATERVVQAVQAQQLSDPTPCALWDVRGVLNHLVGVLQIHAAALRDDTPAVSLDGMGQAEGDFLGDDPLKAYRTAAEDFVAAAGTDGALDRVHHTPVGDMPGGIEASAVTMDVVVHGWDVARATRQAFVIDDDIAEALLGFVSGWITDDMRVPHFDPAVIPAADASALDRLVAFLGRTP